MPHVTDMYIKWAKEAIDEWDGLDTAELVAAIYDKTGENNPHVELGKLCTKLRNYLDSAGAFTIGDCRIVSLPQNRWCFEGPATRQMTLADSLDEVIAKAESAMASQPTA